MIPVHKDMLRFLCSVLDKRSAIGFLETYGEELFREKILLPRRYRRMLHAYNGIKWQPITHYIGHRDPMYGDRRG